MNGRVYAINPLRRVVAIETELHGYTIVELREPVDLQTGDEIDWPSDLELGEQVYGNLNTGQRLAVLVLSHFVSKSSVRQHLAS